MTNPRLFREFCLPAYQRYVELLHGQGRTVGSHTDGDVRPLLALLKESGLDVCESFSPWPLTSCRFEEAWAAWHGGPLIWGGIPSPLLEEDRTDEETFRSAIDRLLDTVGGGADHPGHRRPGAGQQLDRTGPLDRRARLGPGRERWSAQRKR